MAMERRCPVKTMRLSFFEGEPIVPLMESSPLHSTMRVYNLVFEAESFLYKLIRRITGTLVHIAKGQMTLQDVHDRFSCPPDYYDSSYPTTMKPHGLFLYQVKYNEEHFLNPPVMSHDESTTDDIDDVIQEIQDDDDEDEDDDQELDHKMIAVR